MFFFLALFSGALTSMSRVINAALGARVGSLHGSFVNHVVGTLGAAALLALGLGAGTLGIGGLPLVYYAGGCLGVLVVAASNYAAARIGVVLLSMLMLSFQLATSAVIDHYGWLGAARLPFSLQKGAGLLLLIAGALLALTERSGQRRPDASAEATFEEEPPSEGGG